MLTAITLKNFRSYKEATLPLASLTVLIGANASGKSNAVDALRFLSWLAQGGQLSQLQYEASQGGVSLRGGVADIPFHGTDTFSLGCEIDRAQWNRLELEMSLRQGELHVTQERVEPLYKVAKQSHGQDTEITVDCGMFALAHIRCMDQRAIFTQLTSPALFDGRKEIPETAQAYSTALADIFILDAIPAKMRGYSSPTEKRLRSDGANVSGILYQLWTDEHAAQEQRDSILSFIQSLPEQNISKLEFLEEPLGGKMIQLTETFGGTERAYAASMLSDGTLRVLAIAAIMLSAEKGSLVVIEEIDNGVHPSRVAHLVAKIREIAERRGLRVLLSTHNPALLDALPDAAIPDVVYCYRDPQDGSSRLVRLEDIPDYPELMAQGSLGYLSTSGALERFVKSHPGSEERKSRALEWLRKMQAEGAE